MAGTFLEKLFAHNVWANAQIITACLALSDAQLDAEPHSATRGTIRSTLVHLASAQLAYLKTLTLPLDQRRGPTVVDFADVAASARHSGEGLLALARDEARLLAITHLTTRDGRLVEPWVLMVQIINHATEHREQLKSMLSALGITPPDLDAWTYGEATGALGPAGA